MVVLIILAIIVTFTRVVQVYRFINMINKLCNIYDRNYLNEHGDSNIQIVFDYMQKDYHLTSEWSAYKWMFFKGPSPYGMVFSLKPITIEGQYGKETVDRLEQYGVIGEYEWEKQNK